MENIDFSGGEMRRTTHTKPFANVIAEQRGRSLIGTIEVTQKPQKKSSVGSIILMDDVKTSGTTLSACTVALPAAGCTSVEVAVLARAVGTFSQQGENNVSS